MAKNQKRNAGFSLVELIIVVAILAVLIGIVTPQYLKYVEKSKRTRDMTTAKDIRDAFERIQATTDMDFGGLTNWRWKKDPTRKQVPDPGEQPTNLLEALFQEMGEVPESATHKDYYWGIKCSDGTVDDRSAYGSVEQVYLWPGPGPNAGKTYELWPDPSEFLKNGAK